MAQRLLVVGNDGGTNVGGSFARAAIDLGLEVQLVEAKLAMSGPRWIRAMNWWLRGRRPPQLRSFGRELVRKVFAFRPSWVVATGVAPCETEVLRQMEGMAVRKINYLTDDPFNPWHRAAWFLKALSRYDQVFSPRRANLADLRRAGCRHVEYLPFAYDPTLHFRQHEGPLTADVAFAGGADRDRVPYIAAVIATGCRLTLHGDYWDRFTQTRGRDRGHADPVTLRLATGGAKVALCLVRRANRDGHTMRSFEIPAVGTCMLTEDTAEHREIFGADGETVLYFRTPEEMVARLRWLLAHDEERLRLGNAAQRRIVGGLNTYRDRLATMLGLADGGPVDHHQRTPNSQSPHPEC